MDPSNTEAPETTNAPMPALVFGRSSKKRKAYRQRADEPVATIPDSPSKAGSDKDTVETSKKLELTGDNDKDDTKETDDNGHDRWKDDDDDGNGHKDGKDKEPEDEGISVAELIRRRKARKPISGVTFRDEDGASSSTFLNTRLDHALDSMELDLTNDSMPMGVQFVKQTGMIGQLVNKHMEEYVDAQLAKRHQAETAQAHDSLGAGSLPTTNTGAGLSGAGISSAEAREQLAMKGKLHEIDLGAEARARNVAMTERATQRMRGTGVDANGGGDDSMEDSTRRLGRDGKPLARKRRDSDDLKRDQLVEQFLHENRMDVDVYTGRDAFASSSTAPAEGRPTDDRIAEQFRREFMEAAAQRMRRKRKPLGPPTKPKTRNEEEILRGPKLGGSRNVRSVMRDKLLQKQEEERHNMPKYEQQLQEQKRRLQRRR
ncbi:hypothetical protein SBRCBS47491_001361 [Sporothrix bragantina]|uniref:mRNA splicing factor RNA helicase n=1 Tax=Sporothrix bragantina TaxID=671064 RepID=A0ABP0AY01_9PEZI